MDVRLQRTGGDAALVGLPVRLHLVRVPLDERGGVGQVLDRAVEFADTDPAVAAVPVHARVAGVFADALREDFDRLPVAPRVADAAAEPDDRVRVVGVGLVVGAGGGDVFLAPGRDLGGSGGGGEGFAQEGDGLGACWQGGGDRGWRLGWASVA
ncbi:MAG: hypothetical protein F4Z83_06215 [Gemmatimonadetes bacterium]|nr:hypothetical protein [Gemmatimonadota bacterium]